MIYTVTFNPAIDYVVRMSNDLVPGMTNRSDSEECYFGGKGINVSTILKNLGLDNTALGFVAGFTGRAIERAVRYRGIRANFITLPYGISRINVKIKGQEETEINGQGPTIPDDAIETLFSKIKELTDGDILILAGSIPNTLPDDIYEQILCLLEGKKIDVVVDATKDLLMNVLKYHPFLIKPNNHELGEMFNTTLKTEEEIVTHAKKLQEMGARNALVSMAGDGAILVTETDEIHKIGVPKGTVRNSVGAGDSMVAGFIAGYLKYGKYDAALKMGTAAGSATAFADDLATGDDIMNIFATLNTQ